MRKDGSRSVCSYGFIATFLVLLSLAFVLYGCGNEEKPSNDSSSSNVETQQSNSAGIQAKASTEDYTWEELSKISEAIGNAADENAAVEIAKEYNLTTLDGALDGTQTKSVALTDGTQIAVQIVGFAHDEKTDGGKAGITFIFEDIINGREMNSSETNSGGWEKSEMRSYLNSEGLDLLPNDLKQVVVPVDKLTNNVGETEDVSSVSTTSDKLWLFSEIEIYGARQPNLSGENYRDIEINLSEVLNAEGSQYKLFRHMDPKKSAGSAIISKRYQGRELSWWERSPYPRTSKNFLDMSHGGFEDGKTASSTSGVVPGFCI